MSNEVGRAAARGSMRPKWRSGPGEAEAAGWTGASPCRRTRSSATWRTPSASPSTSVSPAAEGRRVSPVPCRSPFSLSLSERQREKRRGRRTETSRRARRDLQSLRLRDERRGGRRRTATPGVPCARPGGVAPDGSGSFRARPPQALALARRLQRPASLWISGLGGGNGETV